jgi:hypothetical protein
MLNEWTIVAEAELSTINKQSWILYGKNFLISCSCNRFCQHPLCACVTYYTYTSFEEYASMLGFLNFKVTMTTDTGRTDTSRPKCSQKHGSYVTQCAACSPCEHMWEWLHSATCPVPDLLKWTCVWHNVSVWPTSRHEVHRPVTTECCRNYEGLANCWWG